MAFVLVLVEMELHRRYSLVMIRVLRQGARRALL